MSTQAQPIFDMSKAQPIQPLFDMSKAVPIGSAEGEASGGGVPDGHWLSASKDALEDYVKGIGEGALQDVTSVSRLLNKLPGVGETLAPSAGVQAMRQIATPSNTAQKFGAGTEQAAELLLPGVGEEGLAAKVGVGALQGATSVATHEGGTTAGATPSHVLLGAGIGAAAPLVGAGANAVLTSKLARGAVNESLMATPTDVAFGNPAKALLDENITNFNTGDLEKFKDAIRSGATLQGAAQGAGGRIAAISGRINQIAPQLQSSLAASTTKIPASTVADVIDKGIATIQANRSVTADEATAAVNELNAIKQAALKVPTVPGATAKAWAPIEANALKQEIGQSVNWAGRERVGQLVDPIKKQVYGALKDAVNQAAPGTAELNERLTNLLAAQSDINKLAGFEEVGRGRSLGGVIGPNWMGRLQALSGRFIPALSWLAPAVGPTIRGVTVPSVTNFAPSGSQ